MTLFTDKAPGIMSKLLADFPIVVEDAAAIVGNLGHECNGFKTMQEENPVVPGSAGGWGWAQWTGPRRRAFEAYCRRNNLHPASDDANYAWLFVELTSTEAAAIPKTKAAKTLKGKVEAFEKAFLRAGVKHYPSRLQYAELALAAYNKIKAELAAPGSLQRQPDDPGPVSPPLPKSSPVAKPAAWTAGTAAALIGLGALFWEKVQAVWDWLF